MKNCVMMIASLLFCCGCGAEQSADEAASKKRFSSEVQAIAESLVKGAA